MEFLLGIVWLGLWLWALIKIINSGASAGTKVLWVLLVLIVPFIGFILWFLFGPK